MSLQNQKGFTLLELLVVVVIIGILAAIAIPQYYSYREKTELASVTSNCRALYRAMTVFYLENDFQYPSAPDEGNEDSVDLTGDDEGEFYPLYDETMLGGLTFDIEIAQLRDSLGGTAAVKATRKYVTDDPFYQKFYFVLPWGKDPSIQFIIAASDGIKDVNDVDVDGGTYLDGVFIWKDGKIKYQ